MVQNAFGFGKTNWIPKQPKLSENKNMIALKHKQEKELKNIYSNSKKKYQNNKKLVAPSSYWFNVNDLILGALPSQDWKWF